MSDIERDLEVKDRDANIRKWLLDELKIHTRGKFGAFLSDLEFMFSHYRHYEEAARKRRALAEEKRDPEFQKVLLEKTMPILAKLFQEARSNVKVDFEEFLEEECKVRTGPTPHRHLE